MSSPPHEFRTLHVSTDGADELVVEVPVPADVERALISAQLVGDVLEIRLPRRPSRRRGIPGFNPDVSGV
jgi:HSP20 family molecular chaperone IbpA